MSRKKLLAIDADLLHASRDYVNAQLDIMAKYGSKPELDEDQVEALAVKCAQYPQELRNWNKKAKVQP